MAVKRRVVWFTDEDWAFIKAKAEGRGYTVSEYLRRLANGHDIGTSTWSAVKAERTGGPIVLRGAPESYTPVIQQPQPHDPDRFNSQPFTGPIPKKR